MQPQTLSYYYNKGNQLFKMLFEAHLLHITLQYKDGVKAGQKIDKNKKKVKIKRLN